MKRVLAFCMVMLSCAIMTVMAQSDDKHAPKYLKNAVPLVNGKVVFSTQNTTMAVEGKELYRMLHKWASERFVSKDGLQARIAYADENKGDIVAVVEEYMVFSSSALSLDRTRIYYRYRIHVDGNRYSAELSRIRYWYNEARNGGQRYTAEEWITDDVALNKAGTKVYPVMGKFRRKTIDLKDDLFTSMREYVDPQYSFELRRKKTPEPALVAPPSQESMPKIAIAETEKTAERKEVVLPDDLAERARTAKISITNTEDIVVLKYGNWGGTGTMFGSPVVYTVASKGQKALQAFFSSSQLYTFNINNNDKPTLLLVCKPAISRNVNAADLKAIGISAEEGQEYILYVSTVISCDTVNK